MAGGAAGQEDEERRHTDRANLKLKADGGALEGVDLGGKRIKRGGGVPARGQNRPEAADDRGAGDRREDFAEFGELSGGSFDFSRGGAVPPRDGSACALQGVLVVAASHIWGGGTSKTSGGNFNGNEEGDRAGKKGGKEEAGIEGARLDEVIDVNFGGDSHDEVEGEKEEDRGNGAEPHPV